MVKKADIINFQQIKNDKIIQKEKIKKALTEPDLYDKHLIDSEITRLRSEFGLNKKEEK